MRKQELLDELAARLGSRQAADEALSAVVDVIIREVANGAKVAITGFGTFEKSARAARVGRNPRTGEAVRIRKTNVPKFRAGAGFKEVVANPGKLAKPKIRGAVGPESLAPPITEVPKRDTAKKTAAQATAKKATAKKATAKKASTATTPAKKATPAKKLTTATTTAKKAASGKAPTTTKRSAGSRSSQSSGSTAAKKSTSASAKRAAPPGPRVLPPRPRPNK